MFTGHKDTDYLILLQLSIDDLDSIRETSQYLNSLCNEEFMKRRKLYHRKNFYDEVLQDLKKREKKYEEKDYNEMLKFLSVIFPESDMREYFIQLLKDILYGNLQKREFVVILDKGYMSGKTTIISLIDQIFNQYMTRINGSFLLYNNQSYHQSAAFNNCENKLITYIALEEGVNLQRLKINQLKNIIDLEKISKSFRVPKSFPVYSTNLIIMNEIPTVLQRHAKVLKFKPIPQHLIDRTVHNSLHRYASVLLSYILSN